MNIEFTFMLFVTWVNAATASSDFFIKGDSCSKFDSCYSKPLLRTCSCEDICRTYGTCCHDFQQKHDNPREPFRCYHGRSIFPVYVKRSCSDDFRGHHGERMACLDEEEDLMDIKNNLLVTSHKTKITYWNKKCAVCSNEASQDLQFWNIEVFCPPHKDVNRNVIRRNLTFDQNKNQWGLQIGDDFLQCVIKYAPPPYIDEVKHCTPNLISDCPISYDNPEVVLKCSQYYAERKLKNSDETFYKNVHCAMCNDAKVKDLECPGMWTLEENAEETDFGDMIEEVFNEKQWLNGKRFMCSRGYIFDPLREMCRRFEYKTKNATSQITDSATIYRNGHYLAILTAIFVLFY